MTVLSLDSLLRKSITDHGKTHLIYDGDIDTARELTASRISESNMYKLQREIIDNKKKYERLPENPKETNQLEEKFELAKQLKSLYTRCLRIANTYDFIVTPITIINDTNSSTETSFILPIYYSDEQNSLSANKHLTSYLMKEELEHDFFNKDGFTGLKLKGLDFEESQYHALESCRELKDLFGLKIFLHTVEPTSIEAIGYSETDWDFLLEIERIKKDIDSHNNRANFRNKPIPKKKQEQLLQQT